MHVTAGASILKQIRLPLPSSIMQLPGIRKPQVTRTHATMCYIEYTGVGSVTRVWTIEL